MGHAPIDPASLASALRPFGESTMLPADAYTAPEVLAWERRHLFAGSWTALGRTADLAGAGNQRAVTVGDVGVLLTFPSDGAPRAFANVCRHRGHELLSAGEAADRPAVLCPYHGWSYALDGRLRTAPRMGDAFDGQRVSARRAARDRLARLAVRQRDRHGAAVRASTSARSPTSSRPYRPETLVVKARHSYEVAANWKIIAENYHECYHCPLIHPELCAVTPPNSGDNWHEPGAWVGGSMELRDARARRCRWTACRTAYRLPGVDPRTCPLSRPVPEPAACRCTPTT